MKNNFNKAFTLVELIVVITILSVLATVAFISFQWYATDSRDTKRMADIATISKGLQAYVALNSILPEPSELKTKINFNGNLLLTQWYAGISVLNTLRVSEIQDPVDETFYTYSTNADNTKFQLVGFLENSQTVNNFLQNNIFADYSHRTIYTVGQNVWIILNDTNTPIQDSWNTAVELEDNITLYTAILNKRNIITESGSTLKTKIVWAQENRYGWRAFDPNCKVEDIKIWDQVWAGCNSTLWDWFEWWENGSVQNCFITNAWIASECPAESSIMASNVNASESFRKTNEHWDKEVDNIYGKFYGTSEFSSACPAGWSVPSHWDFLELENELWCTDSASTWWRCDWLGWNNNISKNKDNNVVKALQIPLSWWKNAWGSYATRWSLWLYASKTSLESWKITVRSFSYNASTINNVSVADSWKFSVRCIKD